MTPVESYLTLPSFTAKVSGVHWSTADCSLDDADGVTVFGDQIADFVEGFARGRRLIHFAYIVRFLLTLKREKFAGDYARWQLRRLFVSSEGTLRNAGAFFAQLCGEIPAAREANLVDKICRRLRTREPLSHQGDWGTGHDECVHVVSFWIQPSRNDASGHGHFRHQGSQVTTWLHR